MPEQSRQAGGRPSHTGPGWRRPHTRSCCRVEIADEYFMADTLQSELFTWSPKHGGCWGPGDQRLQEAIPGSEGFPLGGQGSALVGTSFALCPLYLSGSHQSARDTQQREEEVDNGVVVSTSAGGHSQPCPRPSGKVALSPATWSVAFPPLAVCPLFESRSLLPGKPRDMGGFANGCTEEGPPALSFSGVARRLPPYPPGEEDKKYRKVQGTKRTVPGEMGE